MWEGKGLISFCGFWSIIQRSHGELPAGRWRQKQKQRQRPGRNAACWLAPCGFLSLLSHSTVDYRWRFSPWACPSHTSHLSRIYPTDLPPGNKMEAFSHLWFFYDNPSLCQVDKELSRMGTKSFSWRYLLCGSARSPQQKAQPFSCPPCQSLWMSSTLHICLLPWPTLYYYWKAKRWANFWVRLRPELHCFLTGKTKHKFIAQGLKTHLSTT